MKKLSVLVACEFSGIVRDAFIAKGHDAISCDLLPTESPGPHYQGDVFYIINDGFDLMIAHPPCTDLSASGARWFKEKIADGRQQRSVDFFMKIMNATIPKKAVENPVGIMSRLYRKPDQIIQPFWFGHAETKATCLWLVGLPLLVPTDIVEPDFMRNKDGSFKVDAKGKRYSRIHFVSGRMPPEERRKIRSLTYAGVAKAMADQWS